jgi:hypothetical protein
MQGVVSDGRHACVEAKGIFEKPDRESERRLILRANWNAGEMARRGRRRSCWG